ncbi:MAG: hypothetical protein GKR90_26525 [Pseudomonadales bacterium]|nr:hypothetical protein [Pseudomonadales bacterium]
MQIKSQTKLPNTIITIRLNTAKEMHDFSEVTHSHTEYDTDWDELLYNLSEYKGIDSHIYVQYLSSDEQPKNGDVICSIHLYCQDHEKLDYLEAEITKRISTVLTVTWPWERDN